MCVCIPSCIYCTGRLHSGNKILHCCGRQDQLISTCWNENFNWIAFVLCVVCAGVKSSNLDLFGWLICIRVGERGLWIWQLIIAGRGALGPKVAGTPWDEWEMLLPEIVWTQWHVWEGGTEHTEKRKTKNTKEMHDIVWSFLKFEVRLGGWHHLELTSSHIVYR